MGLRLGRCPPTSRLSFTAYSPLAQLSASDCIITLGLPWQMLSFNPVAFSSHHWSSVNAGGDVRIILEKSPLLATRYRAMYLSRSKCRLCNGPYSAPGKLETKMAIPSATCLTVGVVFWRSELHATCEQFFDFFCCGSDCHMYRIKVKAEKSQSLRWHKCRFLRGYKEP